MLWACHSAFRVYPRGIARTGAVALEKAKPFMFGMNTR